MIRRAKAETNDSSQARPTKGGDDASGRAPSEQTSPGGSLGIDLDQEFIETVACLKDLYEKSYEVADYAVALRVRKELCKLLGLYDRVPQKDRIDPDEHRQLVDTLERVREHLLPLGLADEDYPIHEHARVAASALWDQKLATE